MKISFRASLAGVLLFLGSVAQAQTTVIRAGKLLDVSEQRVLKNQIIIIRGDRISEVRSADGFTAPAGAKTIDLSRSTVLPGLIDAHTHLLQAFDARVGGPAGEDSNMILTVSQMSTAQRALLGAKNAREDLEAGITTVRDLGNSGRNGDVALRDAIDAGWVDGPRMMVSTRALSPIGGQFPRLQSGAQNLIGEEYVAVSGVEEARRATRQAFYDGADCIKVIGHMGVQMLPVEELKAIVQEAHRSDRGGVGRHPVAVHAIHDLGVRTAIEAGVDSIEHAYGASDATLKLMAGKRIFLVLTDSSKHDPLNRLWGRFLCCGVRSHRTLMRRTPRSPILIAAFCMPSIRDDHRSRVARMAGRSSGGRTLRGYYCCRWRPFDGSLRAQSSHLCDDGRTGLPARLRPLKTRSSMARLDDIGEPLGRNQDVA